MRKRKTGRSTKKAEIQEGAVNTRPPTDGVRKGAAGELLTLRDWSGWNPHQPSLGLGRRRGGPDVLWVQSVGSWAEGMTQ